MRKHIFIFTFSLIVLAGYGQKNYVAVTYAGDTAGFRNGLDTNALFYAPTGIAVDDNGNIYVADTYNNAIRKIFVSNDSVITLAGDTAGYAKGPDSTAGFNDNVLGPKASFHFPLGICVDKAGNFVYVADTYNNRIRKIWVAKDSVSTLAGTGIKGVANGDTAEFNLPVNMTLDTAGNMLVTDLGNNVIRKIWMKNDSVSTFAGNGKTGYVNGTADTAQFLGLYGITVDDSNTVYFTEYVNNSVRKIRNGYVSTITGFDTIRLVRTLYTTPSGYGNGYVDTAVFNNPTGIAIKDSNIYVADEFNDVIRRVDLRKRMVTTMAGNHTTGLVDGPDSVAEFNSPIGLAIDKQGRFYVADNANNVIRRLDSSVVLGVKQINRPHLSIFVYPNPCSDKVIVASAPNGTAELIDLTGKTIWTDERFKAPYTLSTEGLPNGVYFLRVSAANGIAVSKIVVQH